ncbi:MAG: hypothetical protein AAF560_23300 [Acidobacteriota bacterium]
MIRQRTKDTRALLASIEVFGKRAARGLDYRLAPELADGEALPDWRLSLDLVGRSVRTSIERLRAAERTYSAWQAKCAKQRREAEKLARHEVYPRVVGVRRLIDSQLGREAAFTVHGMQGKTLRKARRLHLQLSGMVATLESGNGDADSPLLACAPSDCEAWLQEIRPSYDRLTQALERLTVLELSELSAGDDKRLAMKAFDADYGEALRLVQAAFAFAGLPAGAIEKLRAYHQRRTLKYRARKAREARAQGRLEKALRHAANTALEWIGGRPHPAA